MPVSLLAASLALSVVAAQTERGPQPELPHFHDVKSTAAPWPLAVPKATAGDARRSAMSAPSAHGHHGAPPEQRAVAHAIDRVYFDRPGDGAVWARGRTYKASFGADGVRYIPFLGSDAPRNRPVRFELDSVKVGGEPLPLTPATASVSGGAVTLDRGALTERYLLGLESVEQTFVLEDAAAGAIEVRVAVASDLAYDAKGPMPRFECDRGGVEMSAAFAVDARGARTPLATEHDARGYTIIVPETVAARAAFPLTIDPILSTFTVDTSATRLTEPRIALLDTADDGLIVYQEEFSGSDSDVFATRIDLAGNVQPFGYVDMTSERWFSPGVGAARDFEVLLVAAAVDAGSGTDGRVMGRTYDGTTQTLGAPFRIDSTGFPGPKSFVSVGGDPFDRFLVTWLRAATNTDRDVHARVVLQDGSLLGTSNIVLDNSSADHQSLDCSHHNGMVFFNSSRWAIVAERVESASRTIEIAEIDWTGTVAESFYPVDPLPENLSHPHVSPPLETPGPKRYMVTAQRLYPIDRDIQAFVVEDGAVLESDNLSLDQLDGPTFLDNEDALSVDSNGERFVLVWTDRGGAIDRTVATTLLYLDGAILASENAEFGPGVIAASADAAALPTTVPLDAGNHIIVWEDATAFLAENIRAAIHDDVAAPLGSLYCAPNANSTGVAGRTYLSGSGVAGDPLRLHAVQLPPGQPGLMACSRTAGLALPPASDGPLCLAGDIGRFATILDSGPSGEFSLDADTNMLPQPSMFVAAVAGETWHFQAWHRDFGPGGVSRSNFTSGAMLTLD